MINWMIVLTRADSICLAIIRTDSILQNARDSPSILQESAKRLRMKEGEASDPES